MAGLAVIVVNYRTPELTVRCIDAIGEARGAFPGLRLIVVDGFSEDASVERIAGSIAAKGQAEWVTLLPLDVNGGFAFANNRAIAELQRAGPLPELVALINPDARVRPGALEAMAALLAREPRAGAVGGLLIHEDGRRQTSAFRFPSLRDEFCRGAHTALIERLLRVPPTSIDLDVAGEVPWVTGAAVMLRTEALQASGLFDEGFFLYFEETELMHRILRAGWSIWHEPAARVVHASGAATQIRDPDTGLPRACRMPRYWYDSRRRYFALTHGRGYALLTGLAWLTGRGWWRLRQLVVPRPENGTVRSIGDMLQYGMWPSRQDGEPAVVTLDTPPHDRPAWMATR